MFSLDFAPGRKISSFSEGCRPPITRMSLTEDSHSTFNHARKSDDLQIHPGRIHAPVLLVFVVCVAIFGFAVDVRAQVKETIGFERANKSID
jgi:hypothetical protein